VNGNDWVAADLDEAPLDPPSVGDVAATSVIVRQTSRTCHRNGGDFYRDVVVLMKKNEEAKGYRPLHWLKELAGAPQATGSPAARVRLIGRLKVWPPRRPQTQATAAGSLIPLFTSVQHFFGGWLSGLPGVAYCRQSATLASSPVHPPAAGAGTGASCDLTPAARARTNTERMGSMMVAAPRGMVDC
jgi:hypothetical protein